MTTTLTPIKYNIATSEGERTSVLVFLGAETLLATADQPRFNDICEYLLKGVDDVEKLKGMFDVAKPIAKNFKLLSDRVSVANGKIYFDLEPVEDILTETIVRFYAAGDDNFKPLVAFMEKIAQNPLKHSRDNLFRWLKNRSFGITPDGDIIAYKGVNPKGGADSDAYQSVSSGTAFVNGQRFEGRIPNVPGTVVEMPRSAVQHDPAVACHTGLHVGSWGYASSFAQVTIRVKVNPRDVVSVPTDHGDQKMRVCRYKVLGKVTSPDKDLLIVEDAMRTLVVRATDSIAAPGQSEAELEAATKAAKAPRKKASAPKVEAPKANKKAVPTKAKFYEDFKVKDFVEQPLEDLKWLVKEWAVEVPLNKGKAVIADALVKAARKRNKTRAQMLAANKRGAPKQTKTR